MSTGAVAAQSHRRHVLRIYRTLLCEAARFPSVKKKALYDDIRAEFRDGSILPYADPRVARCIASAEHGLKTMRKYTRLDASATAWSVDLEEDPFGIGAKQAAEEKAQSEAFEADETAPIPTRLS